MTSTTLQSPSRTAATGTRPVALGVFLILEGLLALAPMAVLGPAIGWPASLGAPPAEQLAAIHAAPAAVAQGYSIYLLYSLLIAPLMLWLAARAFGTLAHPVAAMVATFAALSALARAIGILRWLTVMPALASAHAAASPEGRAAIEPLFAAITAYGGGIGELLGVSLLMAASLGILCVGAWRLRALPLWLTLSGLIAATALAGMALPALGLGPAVPTAVAVSLLSLWMWAAGAWMLFRAAAWPVR
jgi:Domain of unknown function (DUF4386)